MEAVEWLHIASDYAMTRYTFDICFLQVFLEHTSHLTRWWGTAAGMGAAAPAHAAPARSSQTSFGCFWESEGTRQSWCPWGHHQAGWSKTLSAGGGAGQGCTHTFLSASCCHWPLGVVCLLPDFNYIIPLEGTFILILACFRWCGTLSWRAVIRCFGFRSF